LDRSSSSAAASGSPPGHRHHLSNVAYAAMVAIGKVYLALRGPPFGSARMGLARTGKFRIFTKMEMAAGESL